MRIAIGSDHAGFELKEEAKAFLLEENHEVFHELALGLKNIAKCRSRHGGMDCRHQ